LNLKSLNYQKYQQCPHYLNFHLFLKIHYYKKDLMSQ